MFFPALPGIEQSFAFGSIGLEVRTTPNPRMQNLNFAPHSMALMKKHSGRPSLTNSQLCDVFALATDRPIMEISGEAMSFAKTH